MSISSSSVTFFHPPPSDFAVLEGPASPVHRPPFRAILQPRKPSDTNETKSIALPRDKSSSSKVKGKDYNGDTLRQWIRTKNLEEKSVENMDTQSKQQETKSENASISISIEHEEKESTHNTDAAATAATAATASMGYFQIPDVKVNGNGNGKSRNVKLSSSDSTAFNTVTMDKTGKTSMKTGKRVQFTAIPSGHTSDHNQNEEDSDSMGFYSFPFSSSRAIRLESIEPLEQSKAVMQRFNEANEEETGSSPFKQLEVATADPVAPVPAPLWHRVPYNPPRVYDPAPGPPLLSVDGLKRKRKFKPIGHGKFVPLNQSDDSGFSRPVDKSSDGQWKSVTAPIPAPVPSLPLGKAAEQEKMRVDSSQSARVPVHPVTSKPALAADSGSATARSSVSSSSSRPSAFQRYMAECREKRTQAQQSSQSDSSATAARSHPIAPPSSSRVSTAARSHRVSTPDFYHWNDPELPLYSIPEPLLQQIERHQNRLRKDNGKGRVPVKFPKHVEPTIEGLEQAALQLAVEGKPLATSSGVGNMFPGLDKNELSQQRWFARPLTCFISRPAGLPSDRHERRLTGSDRELTNAVNGVQVFPDDSFVRFGHFDTSFQLDYVPYDNSVVYRINPELQHRVYHRVIQGDKRDIEQKIIRRLAGLDLQSRHSGFK